MARSLVTLIKMQSMKVDEQRQHLARLMERASALAAEIEALRQQQERERKVAREDPASAMTFGAYARRMVVTLERLTKEHAAALAAVELARTHLSALFEEQKRYELAEAERLEAERREELHRETQELDEIGSVAFTRRKKGKGKR